VSIRTDFVTVSYRGGDVTGSFVRSLAGQQGVAGCTLTIVDNAASAESTAALRSLAAGFPGRLVVLPQAQNLWYWGGAAAAIAATYPDRAAMPDWLVVCNNDITFEGSDFLTTLASLAGRDYGVLAPRIVSSATGADQNPFLVRRLRSLEYLRWHLYYTHYAVATALLAVAGWLRAAGLRHRRPAAQTGVGRDGEGRRIYAPHGACIVFSRRYFEAGGSLDARVAMYGEELTTAGIAERLGLGVWYCPRLKVVHRQHASLGGGLTREVYRMQRESFYHYLRTYPAPRSRPDAEPAAPTT
jgi:GT2 family glycosyltransferase